MEEKKYVSFNGLAHYDDRIKDKIAADVASAKQYTDEQVAKKSAIQICTWEAND